MRALKAYALSSRGAAHTTNNASCMQNTLWASMCEASSGRHRALLQHCMLLRPWKHTLLDRSCPRSLVAQKTGSAQGSYTHVMTAGASGRRAQHTKITLASTPPDDPAVATAAATNHTCDKLTSQQTLPPPAPFTQWVPWAGQVTHKVAVLLRGTNE